MGIIIVTLLDSEYSNFLYIFSRAERKSNNMSSTPKFIYVLIFYKCIFDRRKQSLSSVRSLRLERIFVHMYPAEEKTRSASTDFGGIVRRHLYTMFKKWPLFPLCSATVSSWVIMDGKSFDEANCLMDSEDEMASCKRDATVSRAVWHVEAL